jgi:nitrate/TMAO reductase-like tetraheme cytochrome c subunit
MRRAKRVRASIAGTGARFLWAWIVGAGFVVGVLFWGGLNTLMEYANTQEFCISCHEMRANAYAEYRSSAHFQNRSGMRATCSDCHVPREWTARAVRTLRLSNDLYHHVRGTLDTPEKYDAKRRELAETVWAAMKAGNSRECRNCHSYDSMDFHKQTRRAVEKMQPAAKDGTACIECHQGVAHRLPPRED